MTETLITISGDDAHLLTCPLSTWEGDPKRCRWCNAELPKRRRRWCGDEHAREWDRNHFWNAARFAALRRDGEKCIRCGDHDHRDADGIWHSARLQVHHKEPILGRHGETGCHHHLDGLETLCHTHHLEAHHGPRPPRNAQLPLEAA